MRYHDTWHCIGEAHCTRCRDAGPAGLAFRAVIAARFDVDGGPYYLCRRGLDIGAAVPPRRARRHARTVLTADERAMVSARLAACGVCDDYSGEVCERRFPAGCCRGSWLLYVRRETSRCPINRWPQAGGTEERDS